MEKKVNNKSILTKILALGATSTALLGGALLTNSILLMHHQALFC